MRVAIGILLLCSLLPSWSQKKRAFNEKNRDWVRGTVYFANRTIEEREFRLVVSFYEGSLQIREKDSQFSSYSPGQVYKFIFFDSTINQQREFISIQTGFSDRPGSKLVFQELLLEGKEYSLFKRHLPQPRRFFLITGPIIWTFNYAKGRPSLFLHKKDDKAYQVTKSETKSYIVIGEKPRIRYKLHSQRMKILLGSRFKEMKKFARSNKLDLNKEEDLEDAIKFLNDAKFVYKRKETPKKLRN